MTLRQVARLTQDKNIKGGCAVRSFQAGDENSILEAFEDVFQSSRTPQHWNWKFKNNPYHSPILGLAFDERSRVIAHYGTVPIGFCVNGKKVLAAQSVDTLVREEYRGAGLFDETANVCYERCRQEKIEAVYGFPNEAAYKGRVKRLGWKPIAHLDQYTKRLSFKDSLRRLVKFEFLADFLNASFRTLNRVLLSRKIGQAEKEFQALEWVESSEVPTSYSALWDEIRNELVLSIWKDSRYLQWRYDQNPEGSFKYFGVKEAGELKALAVIQVQGPLAKITEVFVARENTRFARYLMLKILWVLEPTHETVFFKGIGASHFSRIFRDFHWAVSKDILCGRVLSKEAPLGVLFYDPEAWQLSLGDTDQV